MITADTFADADPCVILSELQYAKHQALLGKQPKRVRYRSDTGAEREIDNQRVDFSELDKAISQYKSLCDASKGKNSQFCIVAG